jgi:hypothetical protein
LVTETETLTEQSAAESQPEPKPAGEAPVSTPPAETAAAVEAKGDDFDAAFAAAVEKATGVKPAESSPLETAPGKTPAQLRREADEANATYHNQLLQTADESVRTVLRDDYGLSAEDATKVWQQVIAPLARNSYRTREAAVRQHLNQQIVAALKDDPEALAAYEAKVYDDGEQETAYQQAIKAISFNERKRWEGRLGKDLFTAEHMDKLKTELRNTAWDNRERVLRDKLNDALKDTPYSVEGLLGEKSGTHVEGAAGGKSMTLTEIDAMDVNAWNAIGASDADGGHARRQKILTDARQNGR